MFVPQFEFQSHALHRLEAYIDSYFKENSESQSTTQYRLDNATKA